MSREALALAAAAAVFLPLARDSASSGLLLPLAAHAAVYTSLRAALLRAGRIALSGRVKLRGAVHDAIVTLPACALGAGVGWAASGTFAEPGSRTLLLAAAGLVAAWSIHHLHGERRALFARHADATAAMQREVTRALSRTLEERDPGAHDHLRRVHRLCVGVGRRLGLSEADIEAVGAAATLHDLGKVTVPDSILTKPGRLTPAEMRRVERHPVVGAEIIQALPFRRSPAPAIRYHHERWDGRGYPDGLKREEIPLAARILAVIDCYDALTTDRPYRKALTHREAAEFLSRESGRSFDPRVVDALFDYLEARPPAPAARCAAGPATQTAEPAGGEPAAPGSLSAAQRELEVLYDISRAMGHGLSLEEFLTLAGCRLSALVSYQSLVAYFLDEDSGLLRARFAMGRAADKLRLTTIPLGERISGWAASQRRAVSGRDHVTPVERDGSRSDLEDWAEDPDVAQLKATLAAPMVASTGLLGVITIYDRIDRGFTAADRRILVRVAGCVAQVAALEGEGRTPADTSLTDPLTGVPNARFLWLEAAHRMTGEEGGFGLVAFRIAGLDAVGEDAGNEAVDRVLCEAGRRFAAGCRRSETLVRFGQDLFIVLTAANDSGDLVRRWHELAAEIEGPGWRNLEGCTDRLRLVAAHVSYPADGTGLESLFETLDARLDLAAGRGRAILPFRKAHSARAGSDSAR
jgi:diguanylate cyclase (GGDEF)-like protein